MKEKPLFNELVEIVRPVEFPSDFDPPAQERLSEADIEIMAAEDHYRRKHVYPYNPN